VLPSFLPGSVHLFLIGIASRLGLDLLRDRVPSPAAAALCFVGLAALFREAAALWLWGALLIFITTSEWRDSPLIRRLAGMALESPFARAMGARSYSVYILHYPIMLTAAYFILPLGDFGQFEALALIGAATLLLTLAGSDLMYRFVERPLIRIGARLASAITNKTAARKKTGAALDQTLQARTP
jgi:peptidoglycan/LPS O-acetylase OafA/YrhL